MSFAVATYDSSLSSYSPSVIIDIFSGMNIYNFFIAMAPIVNTIIENKHCHYTTATRYWEQLLSIKLLYLLLRLDTAFECYRFVP